MMVEGHFGYKFMISKNYSQITSKMPNAKILQDESFDVTHFLISCYRKVTELMGIPSNDLLKMPVNSGVCEARPFETLIGQHFEQ